MNMFNCIKCQLEVKYLISLCNKNLTISFLHNFKKREFIKEIYSMNVQNSILYKDIFTMQKLAHIFGYRNNYGDCCLTLKNCN